MTTTSSTVPDQRRQEVEPPEETPSADASAGGRIVDIGRRIQLAVTREAVILTVLVASFIARWLLADRNSYWLDELLSVNVYGRWHDSSFEAVEFLAANSIHPPVYQFILYHWMDLFGDTEQATRSLSNLYITLATLFLYLLVRDALSRRVALASAVAFALMYTPTFYGLETRSYSQTIFLVTLSSYALLRFMRQGSTAGWKPALRSPALLLLTVANLGLLLTHYYNAFFWVAQAILAAVFVLRERSPRWWPAGLGAVALIYGAQGAIFALVWGRVLVDDYRRRGGAFPVEGGVQSPFELMKSVVQPNVDMPRLLMWTAALIGAVVVGRALLTVLRAGPRDETRQRAWSILYLVGWFLVPLLVVYVAFKVTGVARYSTRYWLFILPPLAPLFLLTIRELGGWVEWLLRRRWEIRVRSAFVAVVATVAIGAFVLPGALAAATTTKHDWRGIVRQVVDVVQADDDSSYIIYETAHRRRPMTNYYFERFSRSIHAYDTVQRYEEREDDYRILTDDRVVVEGHDYLVVVFTHSRTGHFPNLIAELSDRYELRHQQVNRQGRGFLVFDVHPESSVESS